MKSFYRDLIWVGVAAVLVITPLAGGSTKVWAWAPAFMAVYAIVFAWLMRAVNSRGQGPGARVQEKKKIGLIDYLITAFVVLAVVSFIFSIYKHDSFYALLRLLAYVGLYYLIVNEFDWAMIKKILWVVIAVGTGMSIYGLIQYFGYLDHSWWIPKDFLAATYINHNNFAGYLELVIPVAIAMFLNRRSWARILLAVSLILMAAAFILTQSRGAWVCLAIALAVMMVSFIRISGEHKKNIAIFFILMLVIGVFATLVSGIIAGRMEGASDLATSTDPSWGVRLKIWQGAIGMVKERPLAGFGIGDFDWGFYRYRPEGLNLRAMDAHNDYLQMASEMGVLAPILMALIFIIVVRRGLKRSSHPLVMGCAIGVLSLALHGLVDFNFHVPANMILFVIWLAVVMRQPGESTKTRRL